jgi:hypothetical protein
MIFFEEKRLIIISNIRDIQICDKLFLGAIIGIFRQDVSMKIKMEKGA